MNTKLHRFGIRLLLVVSLLFGGAAAIGYAQGITTGSISGAVHDPTGAVVPEVQVTAVETATNSTFTTKTNGEGYFLLSKLPIGSYTVTVAAPKFKNLKVSNVEVVSGHDTNIGSRTLAIGVTTETVTVEATAPLIETTSAQIGGNFDTRAVSQLPNAGAGFDNLALFVPGVANAGSTNFSNTNGAALANNGLRGRSNNFQIDGQANNDNSVAGPSMFVTNPDVIGEVQVVSNNFGAEYGRNSGTIVNYVTKSGSNSFHGSGFEYYTGNWSFSRQNGQKNPLLGFCTSAQNPITDHCAQSIVPRFVENRYGGTFGGPVIKDRLWFFAGYQNDRQRADTSATSSSITPTPAGIALLASSFPNNPAVAALQTFGPYAIKAGTVTPASAMPQMVPISNGVTTVSIPFDFVRRIISTPFDDTQVTGRADWQISSKDRFFFRYLYQDNIAPVGSGTVSSGAFVAVPAHNEQYGGDYTRNFTPTMVEQVRVSYSKALVGFAGGPAFPQCSIQNVTQCPPNIAFSDQLGNSFTGFGLATNLPQDRNVHNTQYQSNTSWVAGRHTVKFGGEFDHQDSPNHFLPSINGGYTFNSVGTAASDNAFSEFIQNAANCPSLATCSSLTLTNGPFNFDFRENDLYFYGQDDWRIKENLTLNLGLRWEWDQQAVNLLHDISVQNVANGFWAAGLPTSITEIPHIPEDLHNFGPNVGFAWTPRIWKKLVGEDKTVIRAGYRIAYDPSFYNIFANVATTAPVVNSGTVVNVGLPGTLTGQGVQNAFLSQIPAGQDPGSRNQTRISTDFNNPYVEQWSFGIERQLASRVSFETRYVGNHGVGNFQTIDGNPLLCSAFTGITCTAGLAVQDPSLIPAGITPCTPAAAAAGAGKNAIGREDCNFTNLRVRNNGAWSKYNGWQNELKIQNFHGFTADVAYTWSKAMDNVSEIFASTGGVTTPIAQNPFDPNVGERGIAAQSFPNVFTTYWVYELPWMKNQHGLLGHALGGWQWSGTYRYQSGTPITPIQNVGGSADPYCDASFNTSFIGGTSDSCRPILSNANAPFDTSGRYISPTTLINNSNGQTISPSAVHFIVNNTFAINALCNGNPFACDISRNVYQSMARNQLDLAVSKSVKLNERLTLQLRADAFNALNYQYLGVPGLNVNNRNVNGVSSTGTPSPGTFGETWANTGTNRSMVLNAHITF